MAKIFNFEDFQNKGKQKGKEAEGAEDVSFAEIDKIKEDLIKKMKKSEVGTTKSTVAEARDYFNGWTNEQIAELINSTDELTIKKKPNFFIYAYDKMRGQDSVVKMSYEDLNPIREDGSDSRKDFFSQVMKDLKK